MPTICEREGGTGWGQGNTDKLDGVDTLLYFVVISPRDDHVTSKVPNFL